MHPQRRPKRYIAFLFFFGLFLCFLGIGLIIAASLSFNAKCEKINYGENERNYTFDQLCKPSAEATRVKLHGTIAKVIDTVYSLYPNQIVWHPAVMGEDIKMFRPYNCSPYALKQRTDTARELYKKAVELKKSINQTLLKPRELKSLFQLLHYLKTDFGMPYGENYYSGEFNFTSSVQPTRVLECLSQQL